MIIETEKIKMQEMNHDGFVIENFYKLTPEHDMDLIYIGRLIEHTTSHEIKAEPIEEGKLEIMWVKFPENDFMKRMVSKHV